MRKSRGLSAIAVLALLVVALLLGACGSSDEESSTATGVSGEQQGTTASPAAVGEGGAPGRGVTGSGDNSGAGVRDGSSSSREKPASLATDPGSISAARVTSTGAVQTLPPSEGSQAEAMRNSYSSIKAFGEEAEGSEATDITYALVQYLEAKAQGDWATACARLYSVLREDLAKSSQGGSCPTTYGALMSRVPAASRAEQAKIDVAAVRRGEDDRAFVIYKTPATLSVDMPMYLDGGVWTVGALEAYAFTPQQLEQGR